MVIYLIGRQSEILRVLFLYYQIILIIIYSVIRALVSNIIVVPTRNN